MLEEGQEPGAKCVWLNILTWLPPFLSVNSLVLPVAKPRYMFPFHLDPSCSHMIGWKGDMFIHPVHTRQQGDVFIHPVHVWTHGKVICYHLLHPESITTNTTTLCLILPLFPHLLEKLWPRACQSIITLSRGRKSFRLSSLSHCFRCQRSPP